MKSRLIYLLLLCLVAFKGYSYMHAVKSKIPAGHIACRAIDSKDRKFINDLSTANQQEEIVCSEEDDTDDKQHSVSPKERSIYHTAYLQNHLDALSLFVHSFKKQDCSKEAFIAASSPKYITLRVFRL